MNVRKLLDFCVRIIQPAGGIGVAKLVSFATRAAPHKTGQTRLANLSRINPSGCDIFCEEGTEGRP
jgi:hypothetical protein